MGHHISGVLAKTSAMIDLVEVFRNEQPIPLNQGVSFVPLDYENLDDIVGLNSQNAIGDFQYLTPELIGVLSTVSVNCAIMYVETEYFGGVGNQGAAVFQDGNIVGAPEINEWAINDALDIFEVKKGPNDLDKFEAVGLGNYRSNDDFRDTYADD